MAAHALFDTCKSLSARPKHLMECCEKRSHLQRLPSLLQSYLTSSPFTLTLNAVFEFVNLAMFHRSEIAWSHRFTAIYIFSSHNGDAAALSVMKRNFFSLVWTIALLSHALSPSGMASGFMPSWTMSSSAAFSLPFLALLLGEGEAFSALDLSVKAQEMGNGQGAEGPPTMELGPRPNAMAEEVPAYRDWVRLLALCSYLCAHHILAIYHSAEDSVHMRRRIGHESGREMDTMATQCRRCADGICKQSRWYTI